MTRQYAIIGIVALIALSLSNGCRDYPERGPLAVDLYWEIPPMDDAGVSDADVDADEDADEDAETPEPGSFGECEQAGVVRFNYHLEDMSDCYEYSDDWACRYIPTSAVYDGRVYDDDDPIPCDEIPVIAFDSIGGGDYRIEVRGYDKDGNNSWHVICENLYVNGSKTDDVYICDVPYHPRTKDD